MTGWVVQPGAAAARGKLGAKREEVRIELGDMGGSNGDTAYYQDTEENMGFRQEFEDRKAKQDLVLDEIERGVGRMGDIATDMGQELTKQDKLMDEVETNVRPCASCRWLRYSADCVRQFCMHGCCSIAQATS
jgi:hypothetical protein